MWLSHCWHSPHNHHQRQPQHQHQIATTHWNNNNRYLSIDSQKKQKHQNNRYKIMTYPTTSVPTVTEVLDWTDGTQLSGMISGAENECPINEFYEWQSLKGVIDILFKGKIAWLSQICMHLLLPFVEQSLPLSDIRRVQFYVLSKRAQELTKLLKLRKSLKWMSRKNTERKKHFKDTIDHCMQWFDCRSTRVLFFEFNTKIKIFGIVGSQFDAFDTSFFSKTKFETPSSISQQTKWLIVSDKVREHIIIKLDKRKI